MKKLFLSLLSILLLTTLFSNITKAQTNPSSEGTVVATINLSNAKIVSNEGRNYKLSFDISNRIGAQPEVRYAVRLTENDLTVDEKVYDESLSMSENSSVTKVIDYTIPSSIPMGVYKLWIDSKNSSGLQLGIAYLGEVKITENVPNTIQIVSGSCNFTVGSGNKIPLSSAGISLSQTDTLILKCKVQSSFPNDIKLIPNFITRSRTSFGDIVTATGGSTEVITLKNGNNDITLDLPKADKSQDYNLSISLSSIDKKTTSNPISLNYMIAGQSGTIQNVVFDKTYYKVGETANLQIYSTQTETGSITAMILDKNGACSDTLTEKIANFSVINLSVPIIKDCTDPKADITLSSNNIVLDSKNYQVATVISTSTPNTSTTINIFIIVLLVIIIILGALKFKK